ncbi:YebC/PmpR family DNA-binding transcriptional regulator [methane-oxidizing endosymbiont of Gigantopelta aegis]|uniref:YebC/PmpR family DNA-binding transcriptional regulator n=1 Tax=methane-oxidizing endosymbiont of Gigantopelta aegis TaxID=2794938 RepID=UPI001FD9B2EE|nr:YebC/PmpR family DNA-binding transcriptional regulator [methane-oxidizing endosymbiont of Gigantopelta aegis]
MCHDNKRIACTVHAVPLPAEKAAQARRKAKLRAQNKGRTAREKTLYLSEWVLILTSVPVELLSTETAAALYRVRWQVELVIKRLKSLLAINQLRARKDSQLAELYLQGKLLYAAVTEKIAQRCFTKALTKMDGPRALTPWRLYKTIAEDIKSGLNACFPKQERFQRDYLKSVSERPRKRSLQSLPEPILGVIQQCRELSSVAYMFRKVGIISYPAGVNEDAVMEAALEAGAEDVITNDDGSIDVFTDPQEYLNVKEAMVAAGLEPENSEVTMHADNKTDLDEATAEKMIRLIERLEDLDDVQEVYSNADISDDIMEKMAAS